MGKEKGVRRGRHQFRASYLTGPILASCLIRQGELSKGLPKTQGHPLKTEEAEQHQRLGRLPEAQRKESKR